MDAQQCKVKFELLCLQAWQAGLLTVREARLLCRAGTRKAGYPCRHLADLRELLAARGLE